MKLKISAVVAAALLAGLGTGCYSTVDGRTKAGVPWAKDTIESRYERPSQQVFEAAKATLAFNGTLQGENTITKVLTAMVDTRTVYVKVDDVEPKVSRVTVQVRTKGGGSDIDLASEIDKQIALRLVK